MDRPLIRPIEAFPIRQDGQTVICLRDPWSYAESPIFVNFPTYRLIAMMDGQRTAKDIRDEMTRQAGMNVTEENVQALVGRLDELGYLDSPRFREARSRVNEAFLKSDVRAAAHAGASYPSDPEGLRAEMKRNFATAGRADGPAGRALGLIAPHIDPRCGSAAFAKAYRALFESDADTFVIFGTAHYDLEGRFGFTLKHFQTPLGTAQTDGEFVKAAAAPLGDRAFHGELAHRIEHSIEFQTAFLKYVRGDRPFRIVPILCGSFYDFFAAGARPEDDPEIVAVLDAIRRFADSNERRVCYIAGADLSHVGRKFGDPRDADAETAIQVEKEDRELMDAAVRLDAAGFFSAIARDNDRRRVCGASPIYMTLKALGNDAVGKLEDYDRMEDPATGSLVSYASVVFTEA